VFDTAAAAHRVVVVGSGFGGLFAAKALKDAPVEVTLIARTTHHLFQPLLYQVATGILSEGKIAPATREVLRKQDNARVLLGDVTAIDLKAKTVTSGLPGRALVTPYDSLIVAAGVGQSYFGNDHFSEHAPGMKTIDDALELRGRIFEAFELAEASTDPDEINLLLTFVIIGAGPTGVEMAGQISELARRTLPGGFRSIDPSQAHVVLLDAAPTMLGGFGDTLSHKAAEHLKSMGVQIHLDTKVVNLDSTGVEVEDASGRRRIPAFCKIWAAGVAGSPLGKQLADQSGAELDGVGRVKVNPDLTLPGHPEVFVVGDMATLDELPGIAQVAIQGGRHAATQIQRQLEGRPVTDFAYHDKGSMAAVSRLYALVRIGPLRLAGRIGWVMWLVVHLVYIVGFKNRFTTVFDWTVNLLSPERSERTTTSQQVVARTALQKLEAVKGAIGDLAGREISNSGTQVERTRTP
jgi:NADH dehydrogenase